MKAFLAILAALSCLGCIQASPESQAALLRQKTPYLTTIKDTGSMQDRVHGDVKGLVMWQEYDTLRAGQWVVWWPPTYSHPIAHLLKEKWHGKWVTQGTTNCPKSDPGYMTSDLYVGVVAIVK